MSVKPDHDHVFLFKPDNGLADFAADVFPFCMPISRLTHITRGVQNGGHFRPGAVPDKYRPEIHFCKQGEEHP